MTELLPRIEVDPPSGETKLSVIWMHGLGADGHDFEPIAPLLGCRSTRFVFPHAPSLPVTINDGWVMPAWYDIRSLDRSPDRENEQHIRDSAQRIVDLVEHEKSLGLRTEQIVLAGFSQGAAMALHVGLRYPEPLRGLMILSGYVLLADTLRAERVQANADTPVFFAHGTLDPMLPVALGREAYETVKAWSSAEVTWHDYPMGHQVCEPEIADIAAWLQQLEANPR